MPESLRNKLYAYVRENLEDEREDGWEDAQFMYKLRKKSLGPFKNDIWLMTEDEKNVVRAKLAETLEQLFTKLNIVGTAHTVRKYIGEKTIAVDSANTLMDKIDPNNIDHNSDSNDE